MTLQCVSTLPAQAADTTEGGLRPGEGGESGGRPKGQRPKKPNPRYTGEEWAG